MPRTPAPLLRRKHAMTSCTPSASFPPSQSLQHHRKLHSIIDDVGGLVLDFADTLSEAAQDAVAALTPEALQSELDSMAQLASSPLDIVEEELTGVGLDEFATQTYGDLANAVGNDAVAAARALEAGGDATSAEEVLGNAAEARGLVAEGFDAEEVGSVLMDVLVIA